MSKTNVSDLLIAMLAQAGVKCIYGIAGDGLNALTEPQRKRDDMAWVHTRHEEVAAFAAGGGAPDRRAGGVRRARAAQAPSASSTASTIASARACPYSHRCRTKTKLVSSLTREGGLDPAKMVRAAVPARVRPASPRLRTFLMRWHGCGFQNFASAFRYERSRLAARSCLSCSSARTRSTSTTSACSAALRACAVNAGVRPNLKVLVNAAKMIGRKPLIDRVFDAGDGKAIRR